MATISLRLPAVSVISSFSLVFLHPVAMRALPQVCEHALEDGLDILADVLMQVRYRDS